MDKIILSICLPTYNRVYEIERQLKFINSEIGQRLDVEIVVTDNSTNEDTKMIIDAYNKSNDLLRYYKNSKNIGLVNNVIKAVNLCKGEYVWVLGDDDKLEEGVLDYIINNIKKNSDIGVIFLNHSFFGTNIIHDNPLFEKGNFYKSINEDFINQYFTETIHGGFMFISANVIKHNLYSECINKAYKKNMAFPLIVTLYALAKGGMLILDEVFIHDKLGNVSWYNERYVIFSLGKLESLIELDRIIDNVHITNVIKKLITFRSFHNSAIKLMFTKPIQHMKLILMLIKSNNLCYYFLRLLEFVYNNLLKCVKRSS